MACGEAAVEEDADGVAAEGAETRRSVGCGGAPAATAGETAIRSLGVGDLDREYRLHLPAGYQPDAATPLVLSFHGYTGSAGVMPPKGGRMDLSDQEVIDAVAYMVEESQ